MKTKQKGFTLIEIMVVVVMVAILMGAVMMSFPQTDKALLKENAGRFRVLLSLAQDEAILQSRDMALAINQNGYEYFRRESGEWAVYSEGSFVARELMGDIPSDLFLEGIAIKLKERAKTKPQIIISTSGELTPFKYLLGDPDEDNITIDVNAVGTVEQTFKEVEADK